MRPSAAAAPSIPARWSALKKEGFVSVINLRLASEPGADIDAGRAAAQAAGLKYIHLPFNVAMPDAKVVDSFLAAVADKSNQPVFIHCGSANRVGGVWMIKRALQDGWPIEQAQAEGEAIGLSNPQMTAFALELHQGSPEKVATFTVRVRFSRAEASRARVVIYTYPFRARGDFTDLMGRARRYRLPARLYLSREPGPATQSAGFFCF